MTLKSYDYLYKVVLIGDSGVGKTSLLKRYRSDEFSPDTKHTIGVEFATQELEIEGDKIKIQLWDTAGQERYRAITKAYYRGALGAILLYDITEKDTFVNLGKWIKEIQANSAPDMKIMLVGNKCDLVEDRAISVEDGKSLAKEHAMSFLEASAKNGKLVTECFETVVKQIYKNQKASDMAKRNAGFEETKTQEAPQALNLEILDNDKKVKSSCCKTS